MFNLESSIMVSVSTITRALAAPFDPQEIRFKPAAVSGNRALALAYIDARVVQDRLDDVLGVEGWSDEYDCLPDGSVVCRLRLRLGDQWVVKVDVGGPSEQPDGGDRLKAAFSDALKRAAVKFGIGRYLYRLPAQWVEYDPQRRRFLGTPSLPAFAQPSKQSDARKAARSSGDLDLYQRLLNYESQLVTQGICRAGDLLAHIREAGVKANLADDLTKWDQSGIDLAAREVRRFAAQASQRANPMKVVA
ncbi:MAG: Rad52/Rad22 family DNA repair protein [Gemmataceae bacterium]